jgi:NAD-dependent deacetylase
MKLLEADAIHKACDLLRNARNVVVLTGAGISTGSGIADFRSQGSGHWTRSNPMEVASWTAFTQRPEVFFNWLRPLAKEILNARPNSAHFALAELETQGIIKAVLTQNIDRLHQCAGSKNVIELHGSLESLFCLMCNQKFGLDNFYESYVINGNIPRCPHCQSCLKPGIVLYEENLPSAAWRAAEKYARQADVMLVVGTSLEVSPVNTLPVLTLESGGKLIINTFSETYLDDQAEVILRHEISEILPGITAKVM